MTAKLDSREDVVDLRMVKEYLEQYPVPSIHTMEEFVPIQDGMDIWHDFLEDEWDHKLRIFKMAGIKDIEGLRKVGIKHIGKDEIKKMIEVEGNVVAMSEPEYDQESVTWECYFCGHSFVRTGSAKNRKPKCTCDKPDVHEADWSKEELVDMQIVRVQDHPDGKHPPVKLSTYFKGKEMMWVTKAGNNVRLRGVFNIEPIKTKDGRRTWRKFFEVFSYKVLNNSDVMLTAEDEEKIRAYAKQPNFYDKLIDSMAPHIYGLREVKAALVWGLASQGLERPINLLLGGDPETGKSELMWYAVALSHNGHKTDMASSSHVGLTVESAYDEETKSRMATPGLLNFADLGTAGIDELNAINKEEAKKLNGVLENKEIASDKAGVHDKFPARCFLIATTNSEFGRWDTNATILENMKYLGNTRAAIISRFDLIFIIKDIKDAKLDRKKAEKIVSTYGKTEKPMTLFLEDTEEIFGFYTMQKIFAYIMKQPLPEVPSELECQFVDQYMTARDADYNNMVGNRYLKSIIRQSRIVARIFLKDKVALTDTAIVKPVIDKTRDAAAFDPRTNKIDANIISGTTPDADVQDKVNKDEAFWDAYNVCVKNHEDKFCTLDELQFHLMTNHKWDEKKTKTYVDRMIKETMLYEPHGQGKFTKNPGMF